MKRFLIIPLFFTVVFLVGCNQPVVFPDVPVIEYDSFVANGIEGKLSFYFTDGDGDVGLRENDQSLPSNCYITYEEKVNGQWQNAVVSPYRIFYLTPEGQNKSLKGKMEVTLRPTYYNISSTESDTIRFRVKIMDRASHESNEIITPEIYPW